MAASPVSDNATHAVDDAHATSADHGSHDVAYEALYFLFLALVLGALARGAVRGSRLPYTVALLFVGLALGFLYSYVDLGSLGNSLDIWVRIGPHTMLSCFLPALVFESAFSLEWHTFRRCASQVLWLAGPGVLMGTFLMGALLKVTLPYEWGWGASLMLGSILSATDPVAVVALLKEVGASKRLGHIIEGESLVNDGTAIVVFSLLNEIAKGVTKTPLEIFLFFLWVPFGAVLVGVGIAAGCHAWLGLGAVAGDHIVQISVTLFACYLCFLVAEFEAEASGVLAVVVLGVSIGAFGRGFFTGETEHSLHHFWEMLTFVANTVLFILTGVIIAKTTTESTVEGTLSPSDLGWGLLVYFEVLFARSVIVGMLYPILRRCGYGLTPADAAVCVWGGLRGAVGLALALVVSEGDSAYADQKVGPMTLLCTGIVVVLTLAVNGTTTGTLLQMLGLTRPEVSVQVAVRKARRHIRDQCMAVYHEHLTTHDDVMGTADFRAVAELVPFLEDEAEEDAAAEDADADDKNAHHKKKSASRDAKKHDGENGKGVEVDLHDALRAAGLGGDGAGKRKKPKTPSTAQTEDVVPELVSLGKPGGGGLRRAKPGSGGGLLTPASSVANLAAFAEAAEAAEAAGAAPSDASKLAQRNALGELGGDAPDLAAAVSVAVKRDFEEMVAVWMRDVRGRFLAHLKVLYWESLEQGRATKDIVETLVECTDIALDNLDKPLGDWRALQDLLLGKAAEGSKLWKRCYRALPARLRVAVKWVRQWVLHTGAVGAGGSRRRALVAVALFHDAHREACHAIFGHHDTDEPAPSLPTAAAAQSAREAKEALEGLALEYDGEDDGSMSDPARTAAERVRAESEADKDAAKKYLRAARTNEPELAAAVKSEETARRLLAVAERSAKGYVQSGLLTEMEAAELLSGIAVAQRRLRLDPPEPVSRDPKDLMRMCPLLDPTHGARVSPNALAKSLVENAGGWMVRRFPGDSVRDLAPPGGLVLLARGVIDVTWSRPIGDGGGGSVAPLRVGASSTSYGWAYGAADLLVPGAARFEARAVSTVTAFVVPPDVVADILKHEPTADALWRAAFGLLAATLLRDDLSTAEVTPQVLRAAVTKARVTRHAAGDAIGPFKARVDPQQYPPSELVVLMKGAVHDAAEGNLEGPCVIVPSTAAALSSEQTERFGKLAARMGLVSDGGAVTTPEKRDGGGDGASAANATSRRFGFAAEKPGAGMLSVDEAAVVLRVSLGKKRDDAEEERIREGQEKHSYLPGLEGSGWGKFGKNPLVLSRGGGRADELRRELSRRLSVNVGSVLQRSAHHARNGSAGADEFAGIIERTKSGSAARGSSRDGSPEVSAHNGGAFVKSPHGSSENLGALASEGTDLWSSSLDRTSAHILSRDVKRDIFATRRSSVDAQHKAATLEAASLAGSLMAARSDVSPTATHRSSRLGPSPRASINSSNLFAPGRQLSPSTSPDRNSLDRGARRDGGTSMPARMTRQQLAQLRNESSSDDTFPPRRGGNDGDTFPPRGMRDPQDTFPPRGGRSSDDTFPPRGIHARLAGVSSDPDETFPPRRIGRQSARGIPEIPEHRPVNALDVVFDTRESDASEQEAAIKF